MAKCRGDGMKKATLMMVEDEADVLAINREYFEGKGYAVIGAETLTQARFQLEEHSPDLILLDVMMPDGSGFAFAPNCGKKRTPHYLPDMQG